jgi:hypothetical protein
MSDNSRNAGPDGHPSALASFVGSAVAAPQPFRPDSDEDPTSPMKKLAPWPAPDESGVHGPLSLDHMDKYISRAFRPPDPALREIELKLDQIRYEQERDRLKLAVERLARDRKEMEELAEQLRRLRESQPQLQLRRRGRRSEREDNKELLRGLRDKHGGDCRGEFCAAFTRPQEGRKKVSPEHATRLYNIADENLKAETSK